MSFVLDPPLAQHLCLPPVPRKVPRSVPPLSPFPRPRPRALPDPLSRPSSVPSSVPSSSLLTFFTVGFWIKPLDQENSLHSDGSFYPSVSFLSTISPPTMNVAFGKFGTGVNGEVRVRTSCGPNKEIAENVELLPASADGWTFIAASRSNSTSKGLTATGRCPLHTGRRKRALRLSVCRGEQLTASRAEQTWGGCARRLESGRSVCSMKKCFSVLSAPPRTPHAQGDAINGWCCAWDDGACCSGE